MTVSRFPKYDTFRADYLLASVSVSLEGNQPIHLD
jgi:hypothetical protein